MHVFLRCQTRSFMISPTYLLSPHHPHAFPTFLCYPNTQSLDLTRFFTCFCLSTCCSLAIFTLSINASSSFKSLFDCHLQEKSFLTLLPLLTTPSPLSSISSSPRCSYTWPYKHLRVSAGSALSLTGPWGFCKPGLDFSVVFFQHLAYFHSFQCITSTQKWIQHSYSQE